VSSSHVDKTRHELNWPKLVRISSQRYLSALLSVIVTAFFVMASAKE
jgi:hypothetical protein